MGLNFSARAISIYIHVSTDDTQNVDSRKNASLLKLVSILNWEMNNTKENEKKKREETEYAQRTNGRIKDNNKRIQMRADVEDT